MNPTQFATEKQANDLKAMLGTMGGGVTAIYVPDYQIFPTPDAGDKKFYHMDFANGVKGLNVGLVLDTIKRNPFTWTGMIAATLAEKPRKDEE